MQCHLFYVDTTRIDGYSHLFIYLKFLYPRLNSFMVLAFQLALLLKLGNYLAFQMLPEFSSPFKVTQLIAKVDYFLHMYIYFYSSVLLFTWYFRLNTYVVHQISHIHFLLTVCSILIAVNYHCRRCVALRVTYRVVLLQAQIQ